MYCFLLDKLKFRTFSRIAYTCVVIYDLVVCSVGIWQTVKLGSACNSTTPVGSLCSDGHRKGRACTWSNTLPCICVWISCIVYRTLGGLINDWRFREHATIQKSRRFPLITQYRSQIIRTFIQMICFLKFPFIYTHVYIRLRHRRFAAAFGEPYMESTTGLQSNHILC